MLEMPEVMTLANDLNNTVKDKRVKQVFAPTKQHKFCWYNGDPSEYDAPLRGKRIIETKGFGIFVEIEFEDGYKLCLNDGINVRLLLITKVPKDYQLMIELDDELSLVFTVSMYGGIYLHDGSYNNEYYIKSKNAVSIFSPQFKDHFNNILSEGGTSLSAKALLGTKQRFPGVGNGVLQDILYEARIHPKRKIGTLSTAEKEKLFQSIIFVLQDMIKNGGRDTEGNLFGNTGGYKTKMSKYSLLKKCPSCDGEIKKETYLGGTIYYCPICQHYE